MASAADETGNPLEALKAKVHRVLSRIPNPFLKPEVAAGEAKTNSGTFDHRLIIRLATLYGRVL